jgi:hypothetical protein
LPDLHWHYALNSASTSVVKGKQEPILACLEIASSHLAGLLITFHVVGDLLSFDDFAHSGALDGRDMNKCIRPAIIGLNEAEAFRVVEPFYCASGHDEPFPIILSDRNADARRLVMTIFEREIRSGRGANRAITKAQLANIGGRDIETAPSHVNV